MLSALHHHIALFCAFLALCLMVAPALGTGIEKKHFGTTHDGDEVDQYTLTNASGASVSIITYGGVITNLMVPDKNGKLGDVVLGFDNLKQYEDQSPYFGALIGRVGNRIARGIFEIDKHRYCVPVNNGLNSLHGGFKGYDKRVWAAETEMTADGPSVRLTLHDPDGSEGYPGNVAVTVIYSWTGKNVLKIQYFATTDKATPLNLTNHTYFNLKDGGKSTIDGHLFKAYADGYLPVDDTLIPTGKIAPVKGTPMDFTSFKAVGKDMAAMGGDPVGYDNCLCLRNKSGELAKAAEVYEPDSGRLMEMWTTEPGVQFYSGNFLDGTVKGKDGVAYPQHSAIALEAEHYPDSVNHPDFPNTVYRPGDVYRQVTEYHFSAPGKQPE